METAVTGQFGVSNEAPEGVIPDSVRLSFYLGAAVFFIAVLWTVIRSREYSPEEMASFEENQEREGFVKEIRTPEDYAANGRRQMRLGAILFAVGGLLTLWLASRELYQVMVLSGGMMFVATINRTMKAAALAIFAAENILRWLPRGTHQYEKLVRPEELEAPMTASGLEIIDRTGVFFNPLANQWNLSKDMDVNYMLLAKRPA